MRVDGSLHMTQRDAVHPVEELGACEIAARRARKRDEELNSSA